MATLTVRVRELHGADTPDIHGSSDVDLRDYVREIVASGFPQPRQMSCRARGVWLADYIERVITLDFTEQGHRIRRPQLLRGWLRGYPSAIASATTFANIGASLDPGVPTGPSKTTSIAYRDVLSSLYLLDQVDAWSPSQKLLARAALAPKHFLADPALSARLLNRNEAKLLSAGEPATANGDRTRLGDFFVALVALSLQTYAAANDAQVSHFRDHDGRREIDFVIHRGQAEAVGFEVKLKSSINDHDVRHLLWLKESLPPAKSSTSSSSTLEPTPIVDRMAWRSSRSRCSPPDGRPAGKEGMKLLASTLGVWHPQPEPLRDGGNCRRASWDDPRYWSLVTSEGGVWPDVGKEWRQRFSAAPTHSTARTTDEREA